MEANADELWHSPNALKIEATQREAWNDQLQSLLTDTIEDYNTFHRKNDSKRWKRVRQFDTFAVYSDRHRHTPAGVGGDSNMKALTLMSSGFIPGKMENVLSGLFSDDTDSFRIVKSITSSNMLDAKVLHVFESNPVTSEIIFEGIKHTAYSTSGSLRDRDAIYLEKIGWIRDEFNTLFAYHARMSVELPAFPASASQELDRVRLESISLFRHLDKGWIGCFGTYKIYVSTSVIALVAERIAASRVFEYFNAVLCAHAKEYSAMMAASSDTIVPKSNVCEVCQRKPRILSKLRQCGGCRRMVCKRCNHRRLLFRLDVRSRKPVKARFCIQCIEKVEMDVDRIQLLSSTIHASSCSSSPRSFGPNEKSSFAAASQSPASPSLSISNSIDSGDGDAMFWGKKDATSEILAAEWDQMKLDDWNAGEREKFDSNVSSRKTKRDLIASEELD